LIGLATGTTAHGLLTPDASKHGGKKSGQGSNPDQGGTTTQKKKAGRKRGQEKVAKK
jgi:hypothetical protein